MDAGNFEPDILLDALVILLDILESLLGRTAASPVLLLSVLGIISVVVLLFRTELSLLGTALFISLFVLGALIISFTIFKATLTSGVSFVSGAVITVIVTAIPVPTVSAVTTGFTGSSSSVAVTVIPRRLGTIGRSGRWRMIDLIFLLFAHLLPP